MTIGRDQSMNPIEKHANFFKACDGNKLYYSKLFGKFGENI